MRAKEKKPLSHLPTKVEVIKAHTLATNQQSFVLLLYEIMEGITMNKRTNLILISIILGGMVTFLPASIKIALLVSTAIALFMRYDFYDYDQRNEGINHE